MLLLVEIVAIFLLGYCLAHADIGLRKSRRQIDEMPLPDKPFDGETEAVWAELAAHARDRDREAAPGPQA
jgi:hypothetical protein